MEILKELYQRPERELSEYIIKGRNFQGHNIDFKTAWYTIIRNAKIKNFRVHDLRHTAASMAISHGHSEAAIAKMLGHKSTAMISLMSVVDMLNKKHKVMNCVFEVLYDLYGEPNWLKKPKEGQEPEKIIEQWVKELGDYSEAQLKQACFNLFKYKKVATFPKLAHILAELSDQDKEEIKSKTPETPKAFMCLEVELMKQDIKRNKCKYTLSTYKRAVDYIMTTLLKETIGEREFLEMEYSYRNDGCKLRGMQYRKALELGLFDEFDNVLDKMAKESYHG